MLMPSGMDLIQVGVSVTGSLEKNPLRQSQGGACPACRAKWSLHFVHNLCLVCHYFVIYERKVPSQEIDHFATQVWTSLVTAPNFAHSSENSP
jgi:hypothetical protein